MGSGGGATAGHGSVVVGSEGALAGGGAGAAGQLQKRRVKKQAAWVGDPQFAGSEAEGAEDATCSGAVEGGKRGAAGATGKGVCVGNGRERCAPGGAAFPSVSAAVSSCVPTPTPSHTLPSPSQSPATPPFGARDRERDGELAGDVMASLTVGRRVEIRDEPIQGADGVRRGAGYGGLGPSVGVITERLAGGRFRVSFRDGRADMQVLLPSPDVRLL